MESQNGPKNKENQQMDRIMQITQKEYQKIRQKNANMKNDLSAHRQRVKKDTCTTIAYDNEDEDERERAVKKQRLNFNKIGQRKLKNNILSSEKELTMVPDMQIKNLIIRRK